MDHLLLGRFWFTVINCHGRIEVCFIILGAAIHFTIKSLNAIKYAMQVDFGGTSWGLCASVRFMHWFAN